eukprot:TRINITY_DN2997_c0_g5_i2.p1 TRINITY_DN2997_c0_g5~~TRINITY_DN2997_c0_g5_i2.p1  ORF type:complete len:291 (+),score=57.61 TRINITY_DN2997_c0_g5_i2:737-1609(+)
MCTRILIECSAAFTCFWMMPYSIVLGKLSGLPGGKSWAGMNKVHGTIEEIVNFIECSKEELKVLDEPEKGEYAESKRALDLMGEKYDESSSPSYDVTNPATGNSGYVVELRKNLKNYDSTSSTINLLYLQREVFKLFLDSGINSEAMEGLTSKFEGNLREVRGYIEDAEEYREKVRDYAQAAHDYWNIAKIVLQIVFSFCIFVAFVLFTTILFHTPFRKLKYLLLASWILLLILIIPTLLVSAVLFPAAVFMAESKDVLKYSEIVYNLSLIHICRCRRYAVCRSRWSPYH